VPPTPIDTLLPEAAVLLVEAAELITILVYEVLDQLVVMLLMVRSPDRLAEVRVSPT
jgi:hypothetical protein